MFNSSQNALAEMRAAFVRQDFRAAERAASRVLLASRHPEALLCRAISRIELGLSQDALRDFDEAIAHAPNWADAYANRALALSVVGRLDDAVRSAERALALDPRHVDALCNLSRARWLQGDAQAALSAAERALSLDPRSTDALLNRSNALQALGDTDQSEATLRQALALAPTDARVLSNYGYVMSSQGRWTDALEYFDKALTHDATRAEALVGRCSPMLQLGRVKEAITTATEAQKIAPNYASAHFLESLGRLLLGDFELGWAKYEHRPFIPRGVEGVGDVPRWTGQQDLNGKTVLVYGEQGFGDAIQFIRYAKLLAARGARTIVRVRTPLLRLLERVEGVDAVVDETDPPLSRDYDCPLMSLPFAFETRAHTIPANVPYIALDQAKHEFWRTRVADDKGLRVGLAWAGSAQNPNDARRSIPFEQIAALLDVPNIDFQSVQFDAPVWDPRMAPLDPGVLDFDDMAALIANLDLVITVDTSVAHLAGALAKPVWILLPFAPDWRWMLTREDSPWYPTARLFRQSRAGDWDEVIARVAAALGTVQRG